MLYILTLAVLNVLLMSQDKAHFSKTALLASGARWPLLSVSGALGVLQSCLESQEKRHLIRDLRLLCLGENVAEVRVEDLRREGLLFAKTGPVNPLVKDVVLASVRGEGDALFLVSPFINSWDRALSEFLNARDMIHSHLPLEEADQVMSSKYPLTDELRDYILEANQRGEPWANKLAELGRGASGRKLP